MTRVAAGSSSAYDAVADAWQCALQLPTVDPRQTWQDAGGDSLAALHLLLSIERSCNCKLQFDALKADSCVLDLIALVEHGGHATRDKALPLVHLLPGFFGDEPRLVQFRRMLVGRVEFNLVGLTDLDAPASILSNVARAGEVAADAVARQQPGGPIMIAGYSFGGAVAYEAARCLAARGRRITFLGILDTSFGRAAGGGTLAWRPRIRWTYRSVFRAVLSRGGLHSTVWRAATAMTPRAAYRVERALVGLFRERAYHAWKPKVTDIPVWLAVSDDNVSATTSVWAQLCEHRFTLRVPGKHLHIFDPPAAELLCAAFTTAVRSACGNPPKTE